MLKARKSALLANYVVIEQTYAAADYEGFGG
jgi:hypothetical protein